MKIQNWIVGLFLMICTFHEANAAKEKWINRINAPIPNDISQTIQVNDGQFNFMFNNPMTYSNVFTNHNVVANVIVGTDSELLTTVIDVYDITVKVDVKFYDIANTIVSTQVLDYIISYSPNQGDLERSLVLKEFFNYHKITAQIVSITDNVTGNAKLTSPQNLYLQTEIEVERYYAFSANVVPYTIPNSFGHKFFDTDGDGINDEAEFIWNYFPGAESYDLEWTWIDNYGTSAGTFLSATNIPFSLREFELNCSRVTVSQQSYRIPLLFDRGFLVYRIRPRTKGGIDFSEEVFGRWSTDNITSVTPNVSNFPHYFETVLKSTGLVAAHDSKKNWQHNVTYAEDGKRKDVVTYFDGTLRSRQTITFNNSDKVVIAAETFYDAVGRSAIQTMPVPTAKPALKFYEGLTKSNTGINYDKPDFLQAVMGCTSTASPMSNQSGASKYYSINNPIENNWQDFIPDAAGFPFTQIDYTPDLTGRVSSQSMPGIQHKLGSGHETKMLYGKPLQEELDRLFGYNVGYYTHYQKNMTIDANGQTSVSYLDASGKTIATALTGVAPTTLEPVSDEFGNPLTPPVITIAADLLNKDQAQDVDDLQDDNQLFSTGVFGSLTDGLKLSSQLISETNNSPFAFDTKIMAGSFTDQCLGSICFPFVYDNEFSLKNDCGVEQFSYSTANTPIMETIGTFDASSTNCPPLTKTYTAINGIAPVLPVGAYTLSKKLMVNEDAALQYANDYIAIGQANGCIKTLTDFINMEQSLSTPDGCEISCQQCVQELGPDDGSATWKELYSICMEPCTPITPCEASYGLMLTDVSPNGQYGYIGSDANELLLSVYGTFPKWRFPINTDGTAGEYKNANGSTSYVQIISTGSGQYLPPVASGATIINQSGQAVVKPNELANVQDFLNYWTPSWAESLVFYHPERCYLDWCKQLGLQSTSLNYSSEEFDIAMQSYNTKTDAASAVVNSVTVDLNTPYDAGIWKDPFLVSGLLNGISLSDAQQLMLTQLSNFQGSGKTMQDYAAYMVQCGTWYGIGTCPFTPYNAMSGAAADQAWNNFKNLYQSTKQSIEFKYRDLYGISNHCYNGCIGDADFSMFENGFADFTTSGWVGSFFDYPDQPCGMYQFQNYKNKVPRFLKDVGDYDMTGDPLAQFSLTTELGLNDFYLATGRCPLDVHLEALLNKMTVTNQLTGTNIPLLGISEFTPTLYSEVSGISFGGFATTPYQAYQWTTTISGSTLTVQFGGSPAVCNLMTLELPGTVSYNWSSYGSAWEIKSWEQLVPNGGNYNFAVLVTIDEDLTDPLNGLVQKVITGTTCLPIGGCNYGYHLCKDSQLGTELLQLFNTVLTNGALNNTVVTPLNDLIYNTILPASSEIRDIIDVPTGVLEWRHFPSQAYILGNISSGVYSVLSFNASSAFPPNMISFDDVLFIGPGQFRISFTYLVGGVVTYGSSNVNIIYRDRPVTPEGCCFDSDVANDVTSMINEHLSGSLAAPNNLLQIGSTSVSSPYFTQNIKTSLYGPYFNYYNQDIKIIHETFSDRLLVKIVRLEPSPVLGQFVERVDCEMNFYSADINSPVNWASIIISISGTEHGRHFGGEPYPFVCYATLNNGQIIRLTGKSCFNFEKCNPCPPLAPPVPISCNDSYDEFMADMINLVAQSGNLPPEYDISQDQFCDFQYQYCAGPYLEYLQAVGAPAPGTDYYVSLDEFCQGDYGDRLEDYIFYITEIGFPTDVNNPYFVSLKDYVQNGYSTFCTAYAIFYKPYYESNPVYNQIMTLDIACNQKFPSHVDCPKWHPSIDIPEVAPDEEPCAWYVANLVSQNALMAYTQYIDLLKKDFIKRYVETAIATVVEEVNLDAPKQEYHYTLYYYDRAGNLVRTIPPRGVHPYDLSATVTIPGNPSTTTGEAIKYARNQRNQNIAPTNVHNYLTTYSYNSLNQILQQDSPDGGISRFWYDRLSRLTVSQNARQNPLNQYSYTQYDALGRIREVGQLSSTTIPSGSIINHLNFPNNWVGASGRTEVTKTWYDSQGAGYVFNGGNPFSSGQKHLRNRVARVTITESGNSNNVNNYDRATHYSYDVHGNVYTVVQENRLQPLVTFNQQYKKTEYQYDLISGKVNEVWYQHTKADAFYHKYAYDADNRITKVRTSTNQKIWRNDAKYFYYQHGPLARVELGQEKVQGMDYAYTIQGWLKSMNSNKLDAAIEIGKDGHPDAWTTGGAIPNRRVARDAFGFSLTYYAGDYQSRTGNNNFLSDVNTVAPTTQLWNGNIAQMAVALPDQQGSPLPLMLNQYSYDQLHRIKANNPRLTSTGGAQTYTASNFNGDYQSAYKYDNNGNIINLNRNANLSGSNNIMDQLDYYYYNKTGGTFNPSLSNPVGATNKLAYVEDADIDNNYDPDGAGPLIAPDIQNQNPGNYTYDATGNLTSDVAEEISKIEWTNYGKIKKITRINGSTRHDLEFEYDAMGNRVGKIVKPRPGGILSPIQDWIYSWYAHDAQGNAMAIYDIKKASTGITLYLKEQMIYGSSRLGMYHQGDPYLIASTTTPGVIKSTEWISGMAQYELTNHLGNVMATISDRKLAEPGPSAGLGSTIQYFRSDIQSVTDYEPFGMQMVGRNFSGEYRYGFNGKERDPEGMGGSGSTYDYGFRIYNPNLGRFLSVDPLLKTYPWNSTYAYAENDVISCIDLDGLEKLSIHLRSFIRAETTEDPLGRVFDGDGRDASTKEDVTARGRAQFSYDFRTKKGEFSKPYANETVRYDVFGEGKTTKRGVVSARTIQKEVPNGVSIGIHYDTKNPLTPSALTPTVDVDAGYYATFDDKSKSWTVGFYGKSDGYPSTETFVEDGSGQRIMLGFAYEKGSPLSELPGNADTEVFKGAVQIFVDENNNFKSANLINGDKKTPLTIMKPETK